MGHLQLMFSFSLIFILHFDVAVNMAPRNDQYVADLKIVVDVSFSVSNDEIEEVKTVLFKIANRLHISNPMGVQVIKFARQPSSFRELSPYRTLNDFDTLIQEVKDIVAPGSDAFAGTWILRALQLIKLSKDKGLPVILLFTDGYFSPDEINQLKMQIDQLKLFEPEIFVFPYSNAFNRNHLEMFCAPDCGKYLLPLTDYTKIYEHLNRITVENFEMNMFSYIDYRPI